jgi:hypothetical protein
LAWLQSFGAIGVVGVEGTGSYGAGLTRHLVAGGVTVVEVDRSNRQDRCRPGKPLDAESAARAALSGLDYVYWWVDGVHFNVRLEDDHLCGLVVVGVRPDGTKELVALADGYRE